MQLFENMILQLWAFLDIDKNIQKKKKKRKRKKKNRKKKRK